MIAGIWSLLVDLTLQKQMNRQQIELIGTLICFAVARLDNFLSLLNSLPQTGLHLSSHRVD